MQHFKLTCAKGSDHSTHSRWSSLQRPHLLGADALEEELHLYSLEEQVTENVPLEMHIFPKNRHGLSLATEKAAWEDPNSVDPYVARWFSLCTKWLHLIWDNK